MSLISDSLQRAQQLNNKEKKMGGRDRNSYDKIPKSILHSIVSRKVPSYKWHWIIVIFAGALLAFLFYVFYPDIANLKKTSLIERVDGRGNSTSSKINSIDLNEVDHPKLLEEKGEDKTDDRHIGKIDVANTGDSIGNTEAPRKESEKDGGIKPAYKEKKESKGEIGSNFTDDSVPEIRWEIVGKSPDVNEKIKDSKNTMYEYYNNLGLEYFYKGEISKALENLKIAITINPDNFQSYMNLGIVLKKRNNLNLALKAYKKALFLNPNAPEPYYNIGILYEEMDLLDNAISSYKKFLEYAHKRDENLKRMVEKRLDKINTMINTGAYPGGK